MTPWRSSREKAADSLDRRGRPSAPGRPQPRARRLPWSVVPSCFSSSTKSLRPIQPNGTISTGGASQIVKGPASAPPSSLATPNGNGAPSAIGSASGARGVRWRVRRTTNGSARAACSVDSPSSARFRHQAIGPLSFTLIEQAEEKPSSRPFAATRPAQAGRPSHLPGRSSWDPAPLPTQRPSRSVPAPRHRPDRPTRCR